MRRRRGRRRRVRGRHGVALGERQLEGLRRARHERGPRHGDAGDLGAGGRGEERGAYRAAAVENAAAAILVGGKAPGYADAIALAAESIDSGRALAKLTALVEAAK